LLFRTTHNRLPLLSQAKAVGIMHSKLQNLDETFDRLVKAGASDAQIHQAATAQAAQLGATPLPAEGYSTQ
jgi:hypothetical protein